ncbi:MAG: hypothetical protein JST30_00580 [Armatimonadetes bacterium]|nr:hypothetical protein [Armatimonadota bacterium]
MKRLTFALLSLALIVAGCSGGGGDAAKPGNPDVDMKSPIGADGGKAGADTGGTTGGGTTTAVDFEKDVKPVVTEYCATCHGGEKPAGGIDATKIATNDDAKGAGPTFAKMADEVEGGKMPPPKGKPLPADVKAKLVADLRALGS